MEKVQNCDIDYSSILEKNKLIETLEKWFNIQGKSDFNHLNNLLIYNGLPTLCSYELLSNIDTWSIWTYDVKFTITYDQDAEIYYLHSPIEWYISSSFWYIKNNQFIQKLDFWKIDAWFNNTSVPLINKCLWTENTNLNLINSQNEELRQMNEKLRENQQNLLQQVAQNRREIEKLKVDIDTHSCKIDWWEWEHDGENDIENDTQIHQSEELVSIDIEDNTWPRDYKVKSGDNMWNIVKTHYWLTSNRDIANCVNKLVKYNIEHDHAWKLADDNTPDGIFWDKLYVGQKILLAKELTFRKQKFTLQ